MLIVCEEDVTESLEDLTVRGYCFHGSSRKIDDVLIPQQATDSVKESGNRKAVYMTRNPLLAEFVALSGGRDVGKRISECYMAVDNGKVTYPTPPHFAVEKIGEISDEGYIYVFDSRLSELEEVNGEILSYVPIEPLFAIKMKKVDFKFPIETIK